ncbi:MAG: SMP-30/gluconolactonase/LRE family protein [Cyanobacteria bacterium J06633_23]
MHALISEEATLQKLAEGLDHSEGPVYMPEDDSVIWSDVSGNRLYRWSPIGVSVIRDPSHHQNGNCRDLEGRLVSCSHGQRAIVRRDYDGEWRVLVSHYRGNRLNSPNDLVVRSDGSIWFTDPPFGLTQPNEGYGGNQEQPGSFVYCFNPATKEITAVIKEMERPNGLAFSPDEKILYVSDTSQVNYPQGHHYIRAYDICKKQASNGRVFAVIEPGQPDGLKVDTAGNVFASSQDSVQIYSPDGTRLGKILLPEVCANLTFGGPNGRSLFITAGKSLYTICLK